MKRLVLYSFLLLLNCNLLAKDRVNIRTFNFDAKSKAITYGKFWMYHPDSGKWKSTINNSTYWAPDIHRNFISIKLNRLTLDNKTYYVLIDKFWGGYYEYPSAEVGWHNLQQVHAFTFNEEEILKLKGLKLDNDIVIESISEYEDYFQSQWSNYSDHKNILAIIRDLKSNGSNNKIIFRKTKQSGKTVIRLNFDSTTSFDEEYIEIPFLEFSNLFSVVK